MKLSLQKEKVDQAISYLNEGFADAWLIYASESSDPCLPLVPGVATVGPGIFLFTADQGSYAICSSIDAQDIEESGVFNQVIKHPGSLEESLQELMNELALKKVALNYSVEEPLADGLTTGRYRWLIKVFEKLDPLELVSSEPFLTKLRSIKSATELQNIQQAVDDTIDIYDAVFAKLKPGLTEKQAGDLFVAEMLKRDLVNGIDRTPSRPIVMKNNIAHRPPSDSVIEPGDLVIFDFSTVFNGYVSDIARTVYFLKEGETEAPQRIRDTFETIYEAISKCKEAMNPGKQGVEIDAIARNLYIERSYPEISHATGHQIGQDVHDGGVLLGPAWKRYGSSPYGELEAGMVFTIEPTIFMEDGIHFIVEENVVITDNGAEWLSRRQDQLISIPWRRGS
ncbi:Xaa-Pro peptidase family protein [Planococcus donghaensis]|uniref:M24 family metallopeptidase n=1 Tax=Planococcus donghaensis TaxID=414778 RepID=UPI000C1C1D0B